MSVRPDGPVKDLTPEQKKRADIAGIPADRPGLGAEYPKMVYKPGGKNPRHIHVNEPLRIGNGAIDPVAGKLGEGYECETGFVDDVEAEAAALADGWFLSPFPEAQAAEAAKREDEQAKDKRIAELEAQLASQTRPARETLKAPA